MCTSLARQQARQRLNVPSHRQKGEASGKKPASKDKIVAPVGAQVSDSAPPRGLQCAAETIDYRCASFSCQASVASLRQNNVE
mmetsp:Transcript_135315/g.269984  ORF Transcript_135315/g.269984 Transcript_135315/m.269984 type:complete len:83 (-) Transcript_135315:1319-1567(-)